MANTFVTPTWVTNETALRFMNSVKGVANLNRSYDDSFRQGGAKVGATVLARMPVQFAERSGQAFSASDIYETTKPITLTYQKGIDFAFATFNETVEVDRVRERYTNPAGDTLASIADRYGMQDVYSAVYNAVGTPGTTPTAALTYLQAVQKIKDLSGPDEGLIAVLDGYAALNLANTVSTLFNPRETVSDAVRDGRIDNKILGISEWYQDQNLPRHTTGTFTSSTPVVNGATQTGSTLNCDGWASGASTLKKGDKFTIAGVYAVNPISKVSTGRLQDFVVTADTSDSTGTMATLPISPSIITSGARQTVSGSPADGAAISVWGYTGTYALATTVSPQSLIFHRDFAAFVMADLVEPNGGAKCTRVRSKDWGLSIRYVQQYNVQNDQNCNRMDILFGAAVLQERLAARVAG